MPIVNCFVSPELNGEETPAGDMVDLWARYSDLEDAKSEMTINIVSSHRQIGKRIAAIANLMLPSLWTEGDISALQTGLAKALAEYYSVPQGEVIVMTTILDSGRVVEDAKEIWWNA